MLGYWEWLDGLERGLAAHHAGMLPAFKEVVEELFVRGLVKAVFATETLALGINMPARCVVLERLVKFNGEAHVDLTPGEYTQLTGRAGRRGIDVEGHAVVVWSPEIDPRHVAGLASTRTYPLRSSFRPSYNMAVNLVGTVGADRARELLESSFAQFQADRSVVGLARQVQRNVETIAGVRRRTRPATTATSTSTSRSGSPSPTGRRSLARAGRPAAPGRPRSSSLEQLRVGDVIRVPQGRRAGLAVVLDPGTGGVRRAPAAGAHPGPVGRADQRRPTSRGPVEVLGPGPGAEALQPPLARRPAATWPPTVSATGLDRHAGRRRAAVSAAAGEDAEIALLQGADARSTPATPARSGRSTPAGPSAGTGCVRDTDALREKVAGRTGSLARTFDQVCAVLAGRGYLTADGEVTDAGRMLARIWTEADLLVAECLRRDVWEGLAPDGAGRGGVHGALRVPPGGRRARVGAQGRHSATRSTPAPSCGPRSRPTRRAHGLALTREPDPGFRLADVPVGARASRWPRCWPAATISTTTCRPATSSAGPGRSSTCSGRSSRRRRRRPGCATRARKAIAAVNRGVLAYQTGL